MTASAPASPTSALVGCCTIPPVANGVASAPPYAPASLAAIAVSAANHNPVPTPGATKSNRPNPAEPASMAAPA